MTPPRDYFEVVPRVAGSVAVAGAFSASPCGREPTAEEILARGASEGEWLVPVEMALRCSSSVYVGLIRTWHARGEKVSANARIISRGDRFFATIFIAGRPDLFLALDCWKLGAGE